MFQVCFVSPLWVCYDHTPKGSWERQIPLFQGNMGWWNIIIWQNLVRIPGSIFYIVALHVIFIDYFVMFNLHSVVFSCHLDRRITSLLPFAWCFFFFFRPFLNGKKPHDSDDSKFFTHPMTPNLRILSGAHLVLLKDQVDSSHGPISAYAMLENWPGAYKRASSHRTRHGGTVENSLLRLKLEVRPKCTYMIYVYISMYVYKHLYIYTCLYSFLSFFFEYVFINIPRAQVTPMFEGPSKKTCLLQPK